MGSTCLSYCDRCEAWRRARISGFRREPAARRSIQETIAVRRAARFARTRAWSTCSARTTPSSTSGWRAITRFRTCTGSASAASRFGRDEQRGGLLGHGSILTVTSYPNRTSPVLQGQVAAREHPRHAVRRRRRRTCRGCRSVVRGARPSSVRERLEQHRKNPTCAACHAPMDPLGFALENFDAIGAWRTTGEAAAPVDATGTPAGRRARSRG